MRRVSHDVIWVILKFVSFFSDDAPKRSDDLARPSHCMRAAGSLASRDNAGRAVCPLTSGSSRAPGPPINPHVVRQLSCSTLTELSAAQRDWCAADR
jgi:hypothetical protein